MFEDPVWFGERFILRFTKHAKVLTNWSEASVIYRVLSALLGQVLCKMRRQLRRIILADDTVGFLSLSKYYINILNIISPGIFTLLIIHQCAATGCSQHWFNFFFLYFSTSVSKSLSDLFDSVTPSTILLYVRAIGLFFKMWLDILPWTLHSLAITFFSSGLCLDSGQFTPVWHCMTLLVLVSR